jgi:hypothetical protein
LAHVHIENYWNIDVQVNSSRITYCVLRILTLRNTQYVLEKTFLESYNSVWRQVNGIIWVYKQEIAHGYCSASKNTENLLT